MFWVDEVVARVCSLEAFLVALSSAIGDGFEVLELVAEILDVLDIAGHAVKDSLTL